MKADVSTCIADAKGAAEILSQLTGEGCEVMDGLLSCHVAVPPTQSAGAPHMDLLDRLRNLSDVHWVFEAGGLSFELAGTPGYALNFLNDPAGDPSSVFDGSMLSIAERAWEGDVDAALMLAGTWRGDMTVRLQSPFEAQVPQVAWRVVRTVAVLVDIFADYPWWRSAELIRADGRPVVVVVVEEEDVSFNTPSVCVASLDLLQGAQLPLGVEARRSAVQSCSGVQLARNIALPEELMPGEGGRSDLRLEQALKPKAEACAWAWLCNTVIVPEDDGDVAALEFLGYRRKTFQLGADGYFGGPGGRAYNAYRWATVEESPDRILAVRQVVSLHDGDALPTEPNDVVTAAEPLYRALRAGEVAAVLDTQRQARSIAIDTARQGAAAAQAAAKSTAERTIASLGAVAGVAVANATAVLSAVDSRGIAVGIASLFLFLALWAIFVESPLMRGPISSLSDDLPRIGHLLTEKERKEILDMSVLKDAKRSVRRIRVVAPVIYALGAVLTLCVAHARFGLTPPW